MNNNQIFLGVNVDHIATIREARKVNYPDPVHAALQAELSGADLITVHLREDRRHIQDYDVLAMQKMLKTRLNFEFAAEPEMLDFAINLKPQQACLVPEKREELTTEGGLNIISQKSKIKDAVSSLQKNGIRVSLFVDPDFKQIEAAKECCADDIEIHTGKYAEANLHSSHQLEELEVIKSAVKLGLEVGLRVNAGHGLHYHNIEPIAAISGITELNIGHSIIARAAITGIDEAVRTMKELMIKARFNCLD